MSLTINTLAERIATGVTLGLKSEEVKEAAKQFMQDNGYKPTEFGKQVAISELESLEDYPEELIVAVSTAIATL